MADHGLRLRGTLLCAIVSALGRSPARATLASLVLVAAMVLPAMAIESPARLFDPSVSPTSGFPTTQITLSVTYRHSNGTRARLRPRHRRRHQPRHAGRGREQQLEEGRAVLDDHHAPRRHLLGEVRREASRRLHVVGRWPLDHDRPGGHAEAHAQAHAETHPKADAQADAPPHAAANPQADAASDAASDAEAHPASDAPAQPQGARRPPRNPEAPRPADRVADGGADPIGLPERRAVALAQPRSGGRRPDPRPGREQRRRRRRPRRAAAAVAATSRAAATASSDRAPATAARAPAARARIPAPSARR